MPLQTPLRKFCKEDEAQLETIVHEVINANGNIGAFKKSTSASIRRSMVGQPLLRIEETVNQSLRKIDALVNKIRNKAQELQEKDNEN